MPKKPTKKRKSPKKKSKKLQIKIKKPNIKFKKLSWESIKKSKVTKYSLYVLGILVFFIIADFGVQYLNNDYSVAVVNGQRVTERKYYDRLDQGYGSTVVAQLIEEELIMQEAEKQGITVTDEEIEADLADITEQIGGEEALDSALEYYSLSMDDLRLQIELDLMITKIIEPTLDYTEEDVQVYFEEYGETIFADDAAELEEGELLDYDTYRGETLEYFLEEEISNASSTWLAEAEEEAKIQDNVTDKPDYKFLGATRNILTNLLGEINSNESTESEE